MPEMIRPRADELDGAAPRSSRDGREQMSREAPKPAYDRLWVARSALLKRIAAVPSPTRSRSQEAPDVIVHPTGSATRPRLLRLIFLYGRQTRVGCGPTPREHRTQALRPRPMDRQRGLARPARESCPHSEAQVAAEEGAEEDHEVSQALSTSPAAAKGQAPVRAPQSIGE
jgi:hypothetical protein